LSRTMRSYTRSRTGDRRARVVRRALVMAQVAVAFVLMTGTSLLVVSFWRLLEQEPGFTMEGVTTASFDVPATRYPAPEDAERFVTRALDAVRRVPGVVSAGVTQLLPFGGRTATFAVRRDDQAGAVSAWNCVVSPGYLDAMQIPLLAGRHFDDRDTSDSPPVVVIDEVLAARLWPNGDALGQELLFPPTIVARPMTVIGIVGTVRQASLAGGRTDARGTTYRVHAQASDRGYTLAIRTAPSASVMPAVGAAVQALDPHLPLYDVKAMADRVYGTLAPRSLALTLGTIFVATGLLLATMGIYGVLANLVTERRREFAIRLALGSSVRGVVRLVVGEAALLGGAGVMLGLVGGLWLRDLLRSHVYGVDTTDPSVIAASVAVIALVAAMACLAPVRRVAQVAPATVLEQE
jgi:predicted permease